MQFVLWAWAWAKGLETSYVNSGSGTRLSSNELGISVIIENSSLVLIVVCSVSAHQSLLSALGFSVAAQSSI